LDNEGRNELIIEEKETYQTSLNNTFIKMFLDITQFLSDFYIKQTILLIVSGLFFGVFVLVIH